MSPSALLPPLPRRLSLSMRPVLAETEEAASARAGRILERIRDLRGENFGKGTAKPESIGSKPLLEAAAVGAGANTTALVGTAEQVAESLAEYAALGVSTFLIRGFDPLEDSLDYGRSLPPATRRAVAALSREKEPEHA